MSLSIQVYPDNCAFWFDQSVGIHRHDDILCKPGLYRVIVSFQLLQMLGSESHPDAVCDDFGNLVRVQ